MSNATDTKVSKTMVWVSGEQLEQIRALAHLRGTSISGEVRQAIDMYLEDNGGTKQMIVELEAKLKELKASVKK